MIYISDIYCRNINLLHTLQLTQKTSVSLRKALIDRGTTFPKAEMFNHLSEVKQPKYLKCSFPKSEKFTYLSEVK